MKKTLLTLTLTIVTIFASAQCTPDLQYVGGGIYPDTITNLSDAYVGQPYQQLITIITPSDTDIVASGLQMNATIDNIDLTNVTGLPPNFAYDCDPPNCSFPGGTTKCATIYSTVNPTISDIGLYPITFECISYVTLPLFGGTTQVFIETGYVIEVLDNLTSVIHPLNNQTFELKNPSPNPVENQARIQFISGKPDNIMFRIYNLLGKQVCLREIRATKGANSIDINTTAFPDGIYMYSINNGEKVISKRMLVAK
jgi:hypothetical protein